MQNQNSIHQILPTCFRSDSAQFHPKIEERVGILVPCTKIVQGHKCKFKLDVDSKEYFLKLSDALEVVAKKIEWEDVSVTGLLDPDEELFAVEKIRLAQKTEALRLITGPLDSLFELQQRARATAQRDHLDLTQECVAV